MRKPLIWARRSATFTYGLALLLIFGISLFIRTYFPYDSVFAGDWVRFQINDPWFYMRHVENLAHHFPYSMPFDPYVVYPLDISPDRIGVGISSFFELLVGFFIWVFGAGSQSQQTIDTLGAYFPAVLGAVITIPVFFIGREMFGRKAGLLAAALIAILPGQFLLR
ncbi:MAG: STT3 domain-containing protein, partial [Dehalococcoidia bacterium]